MNKPWTDEDAKYLYEQRALGVSYEDIAAVLERTENACSMKMRDTDWSQYGYEPSPKNKNAPWTEEDMAILYESRLRGEDYKSIAKQLDRPYTACKRKYRSTDWDDYPLRNEVLEKIRNAKARGLERATEKSAEAALEKFRMRADIIADRVANSIAKYPRAPLNKWEPQREGRSNSPEDMGLILSDMHVGQENLAEELGGIGEYSIEVFKKRMDNLAHGLSDIWELHSQLYKIPNLHIFSLGDVVHGMNNVGAWGPLHIEVPIADQVAIAFEAISNAIFYWLTMFDEIHFYGIRGNHGRIAPSGLEKDYNNWDNIVYEFLRVRFENNDRIHFHLSKTWWMQEKIRDHTFLMVHGDDVKSRGGLPINGLQNFMQRMSGLTKVMPDYTIAGHFHSAAELDSHRGEVLINGSFVGADAYSIKNSMPGTRAVQKIFGIHKDHGLTWRYNLDLDVKRGKKSPKK